MDKNQSTARRERRKYARLDIAVTVSYAVVSGNGELSPYAEAISSDISAGGLRLMTPAALQNGSTLDLEIFTPEQEGSPIHASGEVVWQNQVSENSFETGAIIRHMEEKDKKKFLGFVFDQMSRFVGTTNPAVN
ncbi:MAG: PilZ domain-containing protein [Deltaproteobacteria bacterium]|nr:PilZ domain-containing protein [Deltaproteobacteria bacterium]